MLLPRTLLPVAVLLCLGAQPASDVHLEGRTLERFIKTRGRSHVGCDVRWDLGAGTFSKPRKRARGYGLFETRGLGIVVRLNDPGLHEVRRRGGRACVRGRVFPVPPKGRRKDGPVCFVAVREITRLSGKAP